MTWRTDTTITAAVAEIALATGAPTFDASALTVEASTESLPMSPGDSIPAHYHSVTFSDLMPDTLYAYRVGDGERWSEWFHARTASADPEPFSFLYFGDAQNGIHSHFSRVLRAAYATAPDAAFMIHAGDLVNRAHRNLEWGEWNEAGGFIQSMLPSIPVPGNHEYDALELPRTVTVAFSISARRVESGLSGTLTTPEGSAVPLEAIPLSESDVQGDTLSWSVELNGSPEATLNLTESPAGLSGWLIDDEQNHYVLEDITFDDERFEARFDMERTDRGPRHLSVHWRPQFTLPRNGPEGMEETVYYLDYQGVRIIGLNTNLRDSTSMRQQAIWLDEVLSSSDPRWTVVTFHHPVFSSSEGRDNADLRTQWKPVLDAHRVDLVLQGHDHTYARGQVHNLPQGVNTRSQNSGTVYVNSVSGSKMYTIKEDRWDGYDGVDLQRAAENTQLYQIVHVAQDTLRYRSYTAVGELYDAFDLAKQPDGEPNTLHERPVGPASEYTHENTRQE